jgi:hypothetical protein
MCREYHCLPSQLFAEDAEFLRLISIEGYGKPEEVSPDGS